MPGEFDAPIDSSQQQIKAQESKENTGIIRQQDQVFMAEVDSFQQLDQTLNAGTPEAQKYLNKGKKEVASLLMQIAARGKLLVDSQDEKSTDTKSKDKKPLDSGTNILTLASSLKSTLDQYRQSVVLIVQVESQAKEASAKLSVVDALEMNEKQFTLAANKDDLSIALIDGLNKFSGLKKILTNSSGLPEEFRTAKMQEAEGALQKLIQKKTVRDLQQLVAEKYSQYLQIKNGSTLVYNEEFNKLPEEQRNKIQAELVAVKINIINQVEALSCPKAAESFWNGKALFDRGNFEEAEKALTQFVEKDIKSPDFQNDKNLKAKEGKILASANEMLKTLKEVTGDNKDFLDGQKLANSSDIIGAKKLLKKYISEKEGKPKEPNKTDFIGTAKELLKRIALTQVEQVKAKFATAEVPVETIIHKTPGAEAVEEKNPEFRRYQSCKIALEQIEKDITAGKYLDFTDAANAIKASMPNFNADDKFNFIADETHEDEGRAGLLVLARKYRANKQYDLAEQYYMRYFGNDLQKLTKKGVSVEDLRKKGYLEKPAVFAQITNKVHEAKAEYDRNAQQKGDAWAKAKENLWDEVKARAALENELLKEVQPKEALKMQQNLFAKDPDSLGFDKPAWEEFSSMKGIHRQNTALEAFAMTDAELDSMVQRLPLDIALIAISGGLGAAAGRMASGAIMEAGLSAAAREAAKFGVRTGARQFAAYAGGLVVESAVFTTSHAALSSAREGRFTINNIEEFGKEWTTNLVTIGGLGLVGRAAEGLGISGGAMAKIPGLTKAGGKIAGAAGSALGFGIEMGAMGAMNGQLTQQDVAMVLGLKLGHGVAGKATEAIKGWEKGAPGKAYADITMSDKRFQTQEKIRGLEQERKSAPKERKAEIDTESGKLKPKLKVEEAADAARAENTQKEQLLHSHIDGMCPCHRGTMKDLAKVDLAGIKDPVEKGKMLDAQLAKVLEYQKAVEAGSGEGHIAKAREQFRADALDSNTEVGKKIDQILAGKTVEVEIKLPDGTIKKESITIDKRLLTPDTILKIATGEAIELNTYDAYLHKHLGENLKTSIGKSIKDNPDWQAHEDEIYKAAAKGDPEALKTAMKDIANPDQIKKLLSDIDGIRDKVRQGAEVFTSGHAETNAEGKDIAKQYMHETVGKTFDEFSKAYEKETGKKMDQRLLDQIKERVIKAGIDQHIDNPPQYVSHGFDHSLRVMENIERVLKGSPEAVQGMMDKYKITESQAMLMMRMVGICHDFGYPTVGDMNKSLHAVTGTYRFLTDIGVPLSEAMGLDLHSTEHQKLLKNFADGIECHSADKVDTTYEDHEEKRQKLEFNRKLVVEIKVPGTDIVYNQEFLFMSKTFVEHGGEHAIENQLLAFYEKNGIPVNGKIKILEAPEGQLFQGRHVDLPGSAKKGLVPAGIAFRGAELADSKSKVSRHEGPDSQQYKFNPLLALVRYADNLDMQESRFSDYQKSTPFRKLYERLGAERSIQTATGEMSVSNAIKAALVKSNFTVDGAKQVISKEGQKPTLYEGELLALAKNIAKGDDRATSLPKLLELVKAVEIVQYGNPPKPISAEYRQALIDKITEMATNADKTPKDLNKMISSTMAENIYQEESKNPTLTDGEKKHLPLIKKYLNSLDEKSLWHFGGCRPVSKIDVNSGTMTIGMNTDVVRSYKGLTATEKAGGQNISVPVNVYQVWRGIEAYESLTVNGKKMKIKITVEGAPDFVFDPNTIEEGQSASGAFLRQYKAWEAQNVH